MEIESSYKKMSLNIAYIENIQNFELRANVFEFRNKYEIIISRKTKFGVTQFEDVIP